MHAGVLAAQREGIRLFHEGDWSGLAEHLAPEFAFVDRRPLPAPDSDAAGLVHLMQARKGQTPDERSRVRKVYVQSRAIFSFGDVVGTDEHGSWLEWPTLTVTDLDRSGRFLHLEYFAPEQLEQALARFDELAAERGPDAGAGVPGP